METHTFHVTVEVKKEHGKLGEVESIEGTILTEKTHAQIMDLLKQRDHIPERFPFTPQDSSYPITSVFSYQIIHCEEEPEK
jgi:hypothetical protein